MSWEHALSVQDLLEVSMLTGFPQCHLSGLACVALQVAMVMPSVETLGRRTFEEAAA